MYIIVSTPFIVPLLTVIVPILFKQFPIKQFIPPVSSKLLSVIVNVPLFVIVFDNSNEKPAKSKVIFLPSGIVVTDFIEAEAMSSIVPSLSIAPIASAKELNVSSPTFTKSFDMLK